jgi:predicted enzyme related to lactoylglutathione lyase
MSNNLGFFAIHADDLSQAQKFYEEVFGWKFQAWGPPGFFLIDTGGGPNALPGALQQRHEVVPGQRVNGFECTIDVEDIDATAAAVAESGGTIIMAKCEIPTVGWLIKFQDPAGNLVCAKQPATA